MKYKPGAYVWRLEGDGAAAKLNTSAGILAVSFADRDRSILAFSNDGKVRRWSSQDHRMQNELSLKGAFEPLTVSSELRDVFGAASFFADGSKLAVVEVTSGLHLIDLKTGKETGRMGNGNLVAASPDPNTLAITRSGPKMAVRRMGNEMVTRSLEHTSGTIVLLDANLCRERLQIEVAGSDVWALAFSPDGKTLAATSGWESGQIHLYEVATGRETRTIDTPAIRTGALTFSPDGSKIICGMADTSVLVWDLQAKP
jgi:WD40 repeat protein